MKISQISKTAVILFCLLIIFGIWSCGGEAKKGKVSIAETRSVEASLFRQNCTVCHGFEGEGKEIGGRQVPTLREGAAAMKTEEQIYLQILNGGNGMTPFRGQLSEQEIRKLARFIYKDLQGRQ